MRVPREELLNRLPPGWPQDLLPAIQATLGARGTKVVVLDDDPTGTQTVHDVPVLTEWPVEVLRQVLGEPGHVVYILTNSRSVPLPQARAMIQEIAANLVAANQPVGCEIVVVSRSDSTLRGHYPGEVEALAQGLDRRADGTLIIPFFLEGGRLTIDDTHYVADGEFLIPAAETEYARDETFGYRSSNLCAWVSEKHQGRVRPEDVASVSLEAIRTQGPAGVRRILSGVRDGQVCVVNACTYRDMEVFVAALLQAEAEGQSFLYRTAASFVRVRGGIPERGPIGAAELDTAGRGAGGLVIVGSYIERTTQQLEAARAMPGIVSLEVAVESLLDPDLCEGETQRAAARIDAALSAGRDILLYTSREPMTGVGRASALEVWQNVSSGLVTMIAALATQPAWIIAKGGITSSDVATRGLGVRRAHVLGQALAGVPIWRLGPESRWPGLTYVVFPGNVGTADSLVDMIRILRGEAGAGSA